MAADGQCGALEACIALVVDSPEFDRGLNELMVRRISARTNFAASLENATSDLISYSNPEIEIVYLKDVEQAVEQAEAAQQPLLM